MSQSDVARPAWRVVPGQALGYRCWDDEAVLYNDLSGATHLLGPAALCVLEALRPGPAPAAALASRLSEEFDIGGEAVDVELAALLAELARLSLIESIQC